MKTCTKCGKEFPATIEYFYRETKERDVLRRQCKSCFCEQSRNWLKENPKRHRARVRKYRVADPEKWREYQRKWRASNRDYDRDWWRAKLNSNPAFRLSANISRSMHRSIKGGKNGRSWELIVGYTLDDLVSHLESQFTKGMTWGNYGEWEIDHIRPKSDFGFTSFDDPEFKECWSLWNLQPLWRKENRVKYATCEQLPLPLLHK